MDFPKIRRAMKENGSPAIFGTDGDHDRFMTVIAVHPEARVSEQVIRILEFCKSRNTREILNHLNLAPAYTNYKRYILPLLQNGLLAFTIPDNPRSRSQKYKITESRLAALKRHTESCEEGGP
ncbi:MAG: Fic family protein [Candidatus Methanogasteraceae archaeon]